MRTLSRHYSSHFLVCLVLACALLATAPTQGAGKQGPGAREIPIEGVIGPALSHFVVDEIHDAADAGSPLIILRLDTPGGLSTSMREIIKAILASPVPIVGYVAPSGARAASAGTYILYATAIAAMAPATNLGAATPVEMGPGSDSPNPGSDDKSDKSDQTGHPPEKKGKTQPENYLSNANTERRKQINDAVAYIRGLAERNGRNADWAESAVRHAASLNAKAALKDNVINLMADNEHDLLRKIDGMTVTTAHGAITLHSQSLSIDERQPGWQTRLLAIVTNPTVAYLLLMIGIVGLAAEALMPGATVPGVVGGISLIIALFAFHMLPVGYGGAALIILGAILLVAEGFVPSFGALGLGGLAAIIFGSIMLMNSGTTGYNVSMGAVIGITIVAVLILALLAWMFSRSRRHRVETGYQGLIGSTCTAMDDFEKTGRVWLHGESWQASATHPVVRDQTLIVTDLQGLTVHVRPLETDTSDNTGRQPGG